MTAVPEEDDAAAAAAHPASATAPKGALTPTSVDVEVSLGPVLKATPSAQMRAGGTLHSGQTLGRYQLLCPIASGGMGQVWAARQLGSIGMKRLVAIKTALAKFERTPEFEQLFLDEGRLAAAIHHPNVCAIYDIAEENGELFIAMEWIDGGSLAHVLRAARAKEIEIPIRVAARIIALACSGLHAAHALTDEDGNALHVIHRDVSPQNILMTASGHVKVADFGIAKARGQLHQSTETGAIRGKVSYMAPEQFTAKSYDRRVDIFALGCVLYQVLTGSKPFDGEASPVILYNVVEGRFEKPRERRPEIPEELEAIVLKAMSHAAEARYQTAEEMGRAIEGWLAQSGSIVGEAEVASVVRDCCGDIIEHRTREVRNAAETLGEAAPTGTTPGRNATTTSPQLLDPSGASTTQPSTERAAVNRRRLLLGTLAAVCIAGSALAGMAFRTKKISPDDSVRASGAVTTAAPSDSVANANASGSSAIVSANASAHATSSGSAASAASSPAFGSVANNPPIHRGGGGHVKTGGSSPLSASTTVSVSNTPPAPPPSTNGGLSPKNKHTLDPSNPYER